MTRWPNLLVHPTIGSLDDGRDGRGRFGSCPRTANLRRRRAEGGREFRSAEEAGEEGQTAASPARDARAGPCPRARIGAPTRRFGMILMGKRQTGTPSHRNQASTRRFAGIQEARSGATNQSVASVIWNTKCSNTLGVPLGRQIGPLARRLDRFWQGAVPAGTS